MLKGMDLKEVLSQTQAAEKVYQLKKTAEESGEGFFGQKLLKVKREKKEKSFQQKPNFEDKYEKEESLEKDSEDKGKKKVDKVKAGIDVTA